MMTHASHKLFEHLNPNSFLSCLASFNKAGSLSMNSRQVFATPSGTGSATGGAEKTENEDDKKKEEEEKKKKEKEKEEEEKKKKKEAANDTDEDEPEEDDVETTKERIARMAKSAVESSEKIQEEMKLAEKEKYNPSVEKMRQLNKEMAAINKEDEKASEPVKTYLAELTTSKKITKKKAKIIFGLDPLDEKFEAKFKNAMKGAGLDMSSPEAKKLKELKEQEGIKVKAIDKKIKEKMTKLRELTSEVSKVITLKANQEKALKMMSTGVGLSLKPGQVLTYENEDKKDKKKNYATIKEITYDHIEVLDENGNVIEKVPSSQPKVTVESINPATSKIETDTFNQTEFHEWTYQNNVHEDIDSLAKLKESIGFEPKKGSQFEFEEVINSADQKPQYESRNVEIKDLNDRSMMIILDKEVETARGKKKEMSFAEFAKWYKQKEVLPELESLDKLRKDMYAHREALNTAYQRDPGKYPVIEVKENEVLYYDDGSNREFVIKKVDEKAKKVVFDNGQEKSFAGFSRWVKKNEVEKRSPTAEAKKASELIDDPKDKAKLEKKIEKETEKKMDDRIEQGLKKLGPGEGLADVLEPSHHSVSRLQQIWRDTHVLSINDLTEMAKTVWELVKRRWGRVQKGRVGAAGLMMFGHNAVGAEFKSMAQSAENEEVNHHVHVMETMGIADVKGELHHPPDKDTLKAAITVLCKKGQMRWDDHGFWHALEHFSGQSINPTPPKYLEDIERILDAWWGQDTFLEYRRSQDSGYKSVKGSFMDTAKRLENDPSGLRGELKRLLFNFIKGEYVNPCQYEAYLAYAFSAGKMAFEDKMFFLLMGAAAQDPHGNTLLSIERIAELDGDHMVAVPLIEFFTSPWIQKYNAKGEAVRKKNEDGTYGEFEQSRPDLNTFKYWMNKYVMPEIPGGDLSKLTSPDQLYWKQDGKKSSIFADFVRDEIAWDPWARYRMQKASRDPSGWDHDDMDMFVHLLDEGSIEQILRYSGGARLQVSYVGLMNSFAGLNEFLKRKISDTKESTQKGDKEKAQKDYAEVIRMLKAFVRFDAIVSDRIEHGQTTKVRFSDDQFQTKPLCSPDHTTIEFINDMRGLVKNLSEQVGMDEDYKKLMDKVPSTDKAKCEAQAAVAKGYGGNLQAKLQEYIEKNGLEKLISSMDETKLRGLSNKVTDRSADTSAKAEAAGMQSLAAQASDAEEGAVSNKKGKQSKDRSADTHAISAEEERHAA